MEQVFFLFTENQEENGTSTRICWARRFRHIRVEEGATCIIPLRGLLVIQLGYHRNDILRIADMPQSPVKVMSVELMAGNCLEVLQVHCILFTCITECYQHGVIAPVRQGPGVSCPRVAVPSFSCCVR